jgi:hypothetical protein
MTGLSRPLIIATSAALLVVNASLPSQAGCHIAHRSSSLYDGAWSIVFQTTQGICPPTIRAGVRILANRVLPTDKDYVVEGDVTPTGVVRVNVSAAGQGADGSGHLSRNAGQGNWRASSGECSGEWTAERSAVPKSSN